MNFVRQLRYWPILWGLLTVPAGAATTNAPAGPDPVYTVTNQAAPAAVSVSEFVAPKLKAAEVCIEKLQLLVTQLTNLHASLTNQAPRRDCVQQRLLKVTALYELAKVAPARLANLTNDDDRGTAEAEFERVTLALARSENLVAEADDCLNLPLPPVTTPPVPQKVKLPDALAGATRVSLKPNAVSLRPGQPARPYVVRDPHQCLKQGELARLLAQAMSLSLGVTDTMEAAMNALTRLGIQPSGGWQPLHAVNLDDFCVVVALALRLEIDPTAPPSLSWQALREEGLPVDQIFPGYSGRNEAPLLIEAEVRRFFAAGLAAPSKPSAP